jgi:malate dehydrogenase (quinone)
MLGILPRCFREESKSAEWQRKLKEMAPSYGQLLTKEELQLSRKQTSRILRFD